MSCTKWCQTFQLPFIRTLNINLLLLYICIGSSDQIAEEDFVTALKGFKPAALRGVALHSAGDLGWSDVGGLANVKDALMETLLWPTKVNLSITRNYTSMYFEGLASIF